MNPVLREEVELVVQRTWQAIGLLQGAWSRRNHRRDLVWASLLVWSFLVVSTLKP
ncbi:MAG: hypothetical protein KDA66_12595 [Planctomycetaceae bacterium]|nr:hypothetical protein [Planctomycetaceae bacterium]MCB9953093.1 hypothetical protein [Planctomycetaceae bacterium]